MIGAAAVAGRFGLLVSRGAVTIGVKSKLGLMSSQRVLFREALVNC